MGSVRPITGLEPCPFYQLCGRASSASQPARNQADTGKQRRSSSCRPTPSLPHTTILSFIPWYTLDNPFLFLQFSFVISCYKPHSYLYSSQPSLYPFLLYLSLIHNMAPKEHGQNTTDVRTGYERHHGTLGEKHGEHSRSVNASTYQPPRIPLSACTIHIPHSLLHQTHTYTLSLAPWFLFKFTYFHSPYQFLSLLLC
jgi:hypothetical protein